MITVTDRLCRPCQLLVVSGPKLFNPQEDLQYAEARGSSNPQGRKLNF